MSQHSSLKSSAKGKAHRSVWKRFERLKFLVEKDKWAEVGSIFGLPKMKLVKLKIKKEKTAEAAAEGSPVAEGAAPAEGRVEATPGKGAPVKEVVKKDEAKGAKK